MRWLLWTAAAVAALTLGGVGAARQDDTKKTDDPAPKFDPKDVRVGPPPELAALRAAVETAAKKGENVDDVRAKLEALEKALAGKAWVRPRADDLPPDPPAVNPVRRPAPPVIVPRPLPIPDINPGRRPVDQPDFEAILRGQALLLEAQQLLAEDPNNRERAVALRRQAEELLLRALAGRDGGAVPPMLLDLPAGRGNGRLGIRVDRVAPGVAEDNNVPAGRGVLAAEVLPNTPAAKAGVKANDIVIEFAGQPVTDEPAAFVAQVRRARAGEKHDMTVIRDGQRVAIRGVVLPAADAPVNPRLRLLEELAPIVGPDGRPLIEGIPGRGAAPREGGRRSSGATVEVRDGEATVSAEENGVRFTIVGTVGPDRLVPTKIDVTENGRTVSAESVDRLPEQYRARARQLLDHVRMTDGR
ncbi:PDZ domain-containing protein [bacterium]|nr:PDZ domain-containing protein [bacterium]